jgi:hypothetical protein
VRLDSIRQTEKGLVAADLIISVGGAAVKYNVYLRETDILLKFASTDRSRVELAARLLKRAGVDAEVKKEGGRDEWYVYASTDKLAAGREELRKALAELVETARKSVGEEKAKRWLEKLEKGRVLKEGWPKYQVRLVEGALVVSFRSTNLDNIKQEAQRFREMGLVEDVHFTVKMPKGGREGYVSILRVGLAYAAWLSVRNEDKQQRELAAEFVELILQRAGEAGDDVRKKAEEIVKEGKAWGSQTLKGFEVEVEVDGEKYKVKVIGGGAVEEDRNGRKLLRIKITAEVDGVRREYEITYSRRGRRNAAMGFAVARADAPGGREEDAKRLVAVIRALTGREPKVYRMKDGTIKIECYGGHLEGFMRYEELAYAIKKWLEETGRR